jgi:hypothetical protein
MDKGQNLEAYKDLIFTNNIVLKLKEAEQEAKKTEVRYDLDEYLDVLEGKLNQRRLIK